MVENLDLIIIGAGPAGMSAAIYAQRAQLNFLIFEKSFPGGQVVNTYEVENYPGIKATTGFELSTMFKDHADSLGVTIQTEEIIDIDISGPIKKVITLTNTYHTKTIILATGAAWKKLGAKGEEELKGMGVSYCATCDGAFYRDKKTVVIGGGDVAVEDAIYLSRMCKKVYLVHRRNELRAVKILQTKLFDVDNIEVLWDHEVEEIVGTENVEGIKIFNNKTNEKTEIEVDGVFVAVGITPNSDLLKDKVQIAAGGWIVTNEDCETSVKGVYAAGDVRQKSLRQIITGAADGAIAVYAAERYIITQA